MLAVVHKCVWLSKFSPLYVSMCGQVHIDSNLKNEKHRKEGDDFMETATD